MRRFEEAEPLGDVVLRTEGCYLGIVDAASPSNRGGHWQRALQAAHADSELGSFNEYWLRLASEGQLQAWTFLFDGVYKIAFRMGRVPHLEGDGFLGAASDGVLWCPSGRVLVGSLAQLGDVSWQEVLTVRPGRYVCSMKSAPDQQLSHQNLERLDDYPADDGPDWTIYLSPTD